MTQQFQRFQRIQAAELRPYVEGEDLDAQRIAVSPEDRAAGSPRLGDMIARNPANHRDQWLVGAEYFAANFEPEPCDSGVRWELEREVTIFLGYSSLASVPRGKRTKTDDAKEEGAQRLSGWRYATDPDGHWRKPASLEAAFSFGDLSIGDRFRGVRITTSRTVASCRKNPAAALVISLWVAREVET